MAEMPTTALRDQATKLDAQANVDEAGLLAREDALAKERQQQMGQLQQKRAGAITDYNAAATDLQGAMQQQPEKVQMPNPDLGPPIDPSVFKDFMGGMMTLALIGAAGGRAHYMGAMEALDGSLRGFAQGNQELAKQKREQFDREFKEAQAKQSEADKAYAKILDNKKLTLNMQAEKLRIASVEFEDWDMNAKATQHDFDGMHRRIDQNRRRSDQMQSLAAKLDEQAMFKQMAVAQKKAGESGQANPSADEAAAWDYLIRGHSPPARGGSYERAMAKVAEIAQSNGMSVEGLISASADVKTKLQAKRAFETRTQNLQRAENQLELEIPVMEDALKRIDLPSLPVAARGKLAVLREMGNPDVTRLDQAAEAIFNEFEGIITGNPGTLNVQDVQQAKEQYNRAKTPQQAAAAIDGMKRIIANAKRANDKTRDEIMGGIRDSVNPKGAKDRRASDNTFSSEAEAQAAAERGDLKPGTRVTIGGRTGVWQ